MKKYLPHYPGCFVCGDKNNIGLKRRFYVQDGVDSSGFGDEVISDITFTKEFEGFKGIVHGGVITALIDEAMGWSSTIKTKLLYYTVDLNISFIKPVMVGERYLFKARLRELKKRVSYCEGEVLDEAGNVMVRASGKFFALPESETKKVIDYLSFKDDTYNLFL